MNSSQNKCLVLAGGGHAQLFVLEKIARDRPAAVDVVLINPHRWQPYSGMLSGWMAGHYRLEDFRFDLMALAQSAGARFLETSLASVDAERQRLELGDGSSISYDLLSLCTGSETAIAGLDESGKKLIPIKPLSESQPAWTELLEQAKESKDFALAIVGGGAAGIEIALNARRGFDRADVAATITLIAGDSGLFPGQPASARRRVARWLADAGIQVIAGLAEGMNDGLRLGNGQSLRADRVIAASGPKAPDWLRASKLLLDSHGYVSVDSSHRSHSHGNVFAAGDVCSPAHADVPRSGVQAVRAGPVLANNLLATLEHGPLRRLRPRRRVIQMLADGNCRALLTFGPLSASGHWVWRWKDRIDRRFVARFTR